MRVALVAAGRLDWGGVETYLLTLCRQLHPTPVQFTLVAPTAPVLAESLAALDVHVVEWQTRWSGDLDAARHLARELAARRIALLHTQDPRSHLLGALAARWLGRPLVHTVHLPAEVWPTSQAQPSRFAPLRRMAYRTAENWLLRRRTDCAIYVAPPHSFPNGRRTAVIPNGVLPARQTLRVFETLRVSDAVVLIFVGRLARQKGLDVLLAALAQLDPETPVALWIVGDGPERDALEALSGCLPANVSAHFWGYRADAPALLAAADIFVLPSRFEGLPFALLEAMAAGLPCIVSDVGGQRAVLPAASADLIVPPGDAVCLAAALNTLLRDPTRRQALGEANREASRKFSAKAMSAQTLAVYRRVLEEAICKSEKAEKRVWGGDVRPPRTPFLRKFLR